MKTTRYIQGFTLLELLIALAIFAVVGAGAQMMLHSSLKTQEIQKSHSQKLANLQKAVSMITDDFTQIKSDTLMLPDDPYFLSFMRRGWSNPLGLPRSDTIKVAYAIEDKILKRYYWPKSETNLAPHVQLLLPQVEEFGFQLASATLAKITFTFAEAGAIEIFVEIAQP